MLVGLVGVAAGCGHKSEARKSPATGAAATAEAGELVALIQAVAGEYGEAQEQPGDSGLVRADAIAARMVDRARQSPALAAFMPATEKLRAAITHRAQPVVIDRAASALIDDLIARRSLATAPPARPDLARAKQVYGDACASCHGVDGRGHVPVAEHLSPPPPDLALSDVINPLSPYQVYETVTYGIYDTAMPAFPTLSARDRWAVAFYIFTLRPAVCRPGPASPAVSLAELARATDNALVGRYGEPALACLRRHLGR